jgi:hypothetical protein
VNIRTVKYSFALSLPRELRLDSCCQVQASTRSVVCFREVSRSNFVRRAHRRGGAQCPFNEPLEFRVRIMIPLVVTATFFTDNVATELMILGWLAIREVIQKVIQNGVVGTQFVLPTRIISPGLIFSRAERTAGKYWRR